MKHSGATLKNETIRVLNIRTNSRSGDVDTSPEKNTVRLTARLTFIYLFLFLVGFEGIIGIDGER